MGDEDPADSAENTPQRAAPPEDSPSEKKTSEGAALRLDSIELFERADEVQNRIAHYREQLEIPRSIRKLHRELEATSAMVRGEVEQARRHIEEAARWYAINEVRFELSQRLRELRSRRAPFDAFVDHVGKAPAHIRQLEEEWEEIEAVMHGVGASAETRRKVSSVLVSLRLLRLHASRAELTIARTNSLFERMETSISAVLEETVAREPILIEDFAFRDPEQEPATNFEEAGSRIQFALSKHVASWTSFATSSGHRLLLHLALLLALTIAALRARFYYRKLGGERLLQRHVLLRNPLSSSLLLSAISTIFIYEVVPVLGLLMVLSLALGAASVLLRNEQRLAVAGMWLLLVPVVAHVFLERLPRLDSAMLLMEALIVPLISVMLMKSSTLATSPGWKSLALFISGWWILCSLVGLLAIGLSYSRSAAILVDGSARIMLLTAAFRVAYDVCSSILELGFSSPWALRLNAFAHHKSMLLNRAQTMVRWLLLFIWGSIFLSIYTFYGATQAAVSQILGTTLSAGSLDFSVRSVFVLFFGVLLAIATARFIRFVLAQDVMPRTGLRMGTYTAITSSTYYVILGFGVFTALAAAGLKLDRLTILVSALGVGIGFGLQNIVQNFVSGLILMVERPVNVGDKVQLDQMFGTVETIGFRASRVRTFDGAEVIVPNSNLISDQVVNWSLSDDRRRIEVEVGVKYGTDPEAVLALLLEAAEEHADVLSEPSPDALFLGFGDSSLNFRLRCHTDQGSRWMNIQSELTVAINRKLANAHIEIPFPQRDLHLRSVDESASHVVFDKHDPNQNEG